MANGELCKICSEQETEHELEAATTCRSFVSEVTHDPDCPVLGCNSDCAATVKRRDWEATCAQNRMSQVWFLSGRQLVVLDIGS